MIRLSISRAWGPTLICGGRRRTQQRSVMVTAKSTGTKVDYRNKGRGGRGGGRGGGGGRGRAVKLTRPTHEEMEGSAVLMDKCAAGGKHAPPTVVLKKDKAHLFRAGHPMVYGGAVDRVEGREPKMGQPVLLMDHAKRDAIGWGVFNPVSMYRVRMLQLARDVARAPQLAFDLPATIRARVRASAALRHTLGLPDAENTAYRLVNSEGDRLSGLIADRYADSVVVSSSASWVEQQRVVVEEALLESTGAQRVVWRVAAHMTMEGLEDATASDQEDAEEATLEAPEHVHEDVQVVECGVKYMVGLMSQKTGFYCDQRDSRKLIRQYSANKRVLDCCCYTGGFALNAAMGGASEVVGVDSSAPALERATQNAKLNHVDHRCRFQLSEIKSYLHTAVETGVEPFDIIILDPPKLAPTVGTLPRARGAYLRLNTLAIKLLKPGGLLMTCSCSGAMTQSGEFESVVAEAAVAAGRHITVLRRAGAAPDHTLNPCYPEGEYLTNLLVCAH